MDRWEKLLEGTPDTSPHDIVAVMREEEAYWLGLAEESINEGDFDIMDEHLTGEQIRAIVAEIDTLHQQSDAKAWEAGMWRIKRVEHLYNFPQETYLITYAHSQVSCYVRAPWGNLIGAAGWTYEASDNFEDMHPRGEE